MKFKLGLFGTDDSVNFFNMTIDDIIQFYNYIEQDCHQQEKKFDVFLESEGYDYFCCWYKGCTNQAVYIEIMKY